MTRLSRVIATVGLALLAVAIVLLGAVLPNLGSAVTVRVAWQPESTNATLVSVTVSDHRAFSLPFTAAVLPGSQYSTDLKPVYVLEDSHASCFFGSLSDVQALIGRVANQYPGLPIHVVNASGVLGVLSSSPDAILLLLECGVIPVAPADPGDTALQNWLRAGGTLIWAGGPLGFFDQVVRFPQYDLSTPGWDGQTNILGFPLVDATPGPAGFPTAFSGDNAVGTIASAAAQALGVTYTPAAYGANVSEVVAHAGQDLGYDTPSNSSSGSVRSSLVFLPVGRGYVEYFGGALWGYSGQYLPNGGASLGFDVATLLGSGARFASGPVELISATVGAYSSYSLSLRYTPRPPGEIAVIRAVVGGLPYSLAVFTVGP